MKRTRFLKIIVILILLLNITVSCNALQIGVESTSTPTRPQELVQPQPTTIPDTPAATQVIPLTPTPLSTPTIVTSFPTSTSGPTYTPSPIATLCTDKVKFGKDVTIPDDTRFSPGEKFTKTWRLTNIGTCIWSQQYALKFMDGDQMSGPDTINLTASVAPSQTIDISVDLIAPASIGTYRGNWKLINNLDKPFGSGKNSDQPFWVQIVVGETAPDIIQSLGDPTFTDLMTTADNWYLLDTENTKFSIKDNRMTLTSLKAGQLDEWDVASLPSLKDFYAEARFTTGNACSGLDRYGLLLRSPDPNQGYVFGFSCDGRYRLYIWDGKHYNPVQEWKSSPSILQGPNQTNRLGFWAKGDTIKLFANGVLLAEFKDNTFTEGRLGLFIGSAVTDNFTVQVMQVSYWILNP